MLIGWVSANRLAACESGSLTRGVMNYPTSRLLASSETLGWSAIFAELRSHEDFDSHIMHPQYVELCVVIEGNENAVVTRKGADLYQREVARTGTIWVSPIGVSYEIAVSAPVPKLMHLYLPTATFQRLGNEFNLPGNPGLSIRYAPGFRDEVIHNIALSLLSEITQETAASRMYAETASLMLAGHLIQRYSDSGSPTPQSPISPSLDHARLGRVLDYMAEHITDQITLEDLANVACLSTFHFARMFALSVGVPPHRYLSKIRLENAMAALAVGRLPISEIALKSCFSSQASFTRAFRRATGMTPGEYRQRRTDIGVGYQMTSDNLRAGIAR